MQLHIQPAVDRVKDDHLVCYCRRGGDYSDMKDGRIVEDGTHEELVSRDGLYNKLYSMQFQVGEA